MKITYFEDSKEKEDYVEVHFRQINDRIQGIMNYFESFESILGRNDSLQKKIMPGEIFYCEIVDRKCFAYLKDEVYQIDFTIQGFLTSFENKGFVRIGKSMAVNIYQVEKLSMELNMKVKVILNNGENIILNRAYKKDFMEYLNKVYKKQTGA